MAHDIICHYCIPLLGDFPEDGQVEDQNIQKAHHKCQTVVFVDGALVGLNAVKSVYCQENGKHEKWYMIKELTDLW